MSHAALWKCQGCPVILGQVKAGVLDVFAPRPRVWQGTVAVECPGCGKVRTWREAERAKIGAADD